MKYFPLVPIVSLLIYGCSVHFSPTPQTPNFIIILSDDLSPEQASSLYGANWAETPAFNELAQNGIIIQ